MRILIADDEVVSRHLLGKILERAGYEVTAVENGKLAAEQLCRRDAPRLALLDWVMPELDGPSVCRQVRSLREHPYVHMILLTSKESKQDIVAGLGSGADDYLIKPCDPEELKARLRTGQRMIELEDKLVEAREDMRFKATHDPLTSLFNRGVMMELLSRELKRASRQQGCTTVVLGDVDDFKRINDSYGHLVGDEVLREIARRLLGSVRSYDLVGRYGGEEFLIVLNNCDVNNALPRAEEIRKSISSGAVATMQGPLRITMSLGLLTSRHEEHRELEEILHEVDMALYAAKAAGRDCSKVATEALSEHNLGTTGT